MSSLLDNVAFRIHTVECDQFPGKLDIVPRVLDQIENGFLKLKRLFTKLFKKKLVLTRLT